MDWTQALTIIGVFAAFFIYLMIRMDSNQKQVSDKIDGFQKQTNDRFNTLEYRITSLESEVKHNNQRLSDFQMQVNQRFNTLENYIIPKKIIHEDPKEN